LAKKKQQQKDYTAEIQKSFDRWDHLNVHGGSDPTWTDGVNMNLVRNHILYGKREIEENMTPLLYPEIYYRDTPPEVDRDYMARADEIRVNAKRSLEAYKVDPDYQYLFRIVTHMTERQKKDTSINNVIGYATALENAIKDDNLVTMRRHERTSSYLDSFSSIAEKVRGLAIVENVQMDMLSDYNDNANVYTSDDITITNEHDSYLGSDSEDENEFDNEDEFDNDEEHSQESEDDAVMEAQSNNQSIDVSLQSSSNEDNNPVSAINTSTIVAAYVKNAEAGTPRPVGSNVLMTPLFNNMNLNREGKRIRVTVEEPVGKYQLFSRTEHGKKALYLLTASGRIDRFSEYFRKQWDEQSKEWMDIHPTEEQLDEVIIQIAQQFEQDMADPEKWVKYQHAALLDRIDECEAHNAPINELRKAKNKEWKDNAERKRQEDELKFQDKYNARIDEIAKAIETGETIKVDHDEHKYGGKNPVLDLFRLYDVSLPLKTQGWINARLSEISRNGIRYYTTEGRGRSTTFSSYLQKLRDAIIKMPVEQKRQSGAVDAEVKNTLSKKSLIEQNYLKFAELFPKIASGEYTYLKLEAGPAMMPLSVEWIDQNRISIMHTYKMNGDLMYDPMVAFEIDNEAKTINADEFQQSMPPIYQRIDEDGIGHSIDGNGNERTIRDLRKQLNDFSSQWFNDIVNHQYMPVRAVMEVDGEDVDITFDKDGNPIMPSPVPIALTSDDNVSASQPEKSPPQEIMPDMTVEAYHGTHGDIAHGTHSISEKPGLIPNPAISTADMTAYGYTEEDMLPMTEDIALNFFDNDYCVYLLYPDNTEALAESRDEFIIHYERGGIFGIEKADWEASREYASMQFEAKNSEGSMEAGLIHGSGNRFGIYQIRNDMNPDDTQNYRFVSMNELKAMERTVERNNYRLVYAAPYTEMMEQSVLMQTSLSDLYKTFNTEHPPDFKGHSLSVSDVIVLKHGDSITSHYVDSFGFVELDNFLGDERHVEQNKDAALDVAAQNAVVGAGANANASLYKHEGLVDISDENAPNTKESNNINPINSIAGVQADASKAAQTIYPTYSQSENSSAAGNVKPSNNLSIAGTANPAIKLTLAERLEEGKRKAALGGQADFVGASNPEVKL